MHHLALLCYVGTEFIFLVRSHLLCSVSLQTVHHNAYHEDPYAQEFGIRISERLASVEARILPAPWVSKLNFCVIAVTYMRCHYSFPSVFAIVTFCVCICLILQLKYHDTGREKDCLPQVGQWNMMNKVFFVQKLHFYFKTWNKIFSSMFLKQTLLLC